MLDFQPEIDREIISSIRRAAEARDRLAHASINDKLMQALARLLNPTYGYQKGFSEICRLDKLVI